MVLYQTGAPQRFLVTLTKFDSKLTPSGALETLILIWPSKRVETNSIVKLIKFSFQ